MYIKIRDLVIKFDTAWKISDINNTNNKPVWINEEPLYETDTKELVQLSRELESKINRDSISDLNIVRSGSNYQLYEPFQRGINTFYLNSLKDDDSAVYADIIYDDNEKVAILFLSITAVSVMARIVKINDYINIRRELLTNKKGSVGKYYIAEWIKNKIGDNDKLANIPIELLTSETIASILIKNETKLSVIRFDDWKSREATKYKAKNFMTYVLLTIGISFYVGSWYFETASKSIDSYIKAKELEISKLEEQKALVNKERFYVDWMITPSLVEVMESVTKSLGQVKISRLTGKTRIGEFASIEGVAISLNENNKHNKLKGMRIETVMTNGKVGIRFKMRRNAKK